MQSRILPEHALALLRGHRVDFTLPRGHMAARRQAPGVMYYIRHRRPAGPTRKARLPEVSWTLRMEWEGGYLDFYSMISSTSFPKSKTKALHSMATSRQLLLEDQEKEILG